MRTIFNEKYRVDLFDDPDYSIYADHNQQEYDQFHFDYPNTYYDYACKHGIQVFQNNQKLKSALLIAYEGKKGISINSSTFDNDRLLVCCTNRIFCLTLPDLQLEWHTKADTTTCFEVFQLNNGYLVHGKNAITKLDKKGAIQWSQPMAKISRKPYSVALQIMEEHIHVNLNNEQHKFDFAGNLI